MIGKGASDTTVFKVHWGKITLKIYDKGRRVLRVEAGTKHDPLLVEAMLRGAEATA